MHDVHRDSLIYEKGGKRHQGEKSRHAHGSHKHHEHGQPERHEDLPHDDHMHPYDATREQDHEHVHVHGSEAPHGHAHRHLETGIDGHVHGDAHGHEHEHDDEHDHGYHGHAHEHDESAYERHEHDIHAHGHDREEFEDQAYTHMHEHAHQFYHGHYHSHHSEHTTFMHRVFNDPIRDFFGAVLMAVLILAGYRAWVPAPRANGMLLCAALIGIYPLVKKGLFACLKNRKITAELLIGGALIAGLCFGRFLAVAVITLFMLIGSFFRLHFSWKEE